MTFLAFIILIVKRINWFYFIQSWRNISYFFSSIYAWLSSLEIDHASRWLWLQRWIWCLRSWMIFLSYLVLNAQNHLILALQLKCNSWIMLLPSLIVFQFIHSFRYSLIFLFSIQVQKDIIDKQTCIHIQCNFL